MKRSPGLRWLSVVLRGLHLVAVTLLGALLLGAPPIVAMGMVGGATFLTGATMFFLDLLMKPDHWREVSGLAVIGKLGLVGLISVFPEHAAPIFWTILVWSAIFAHAPASFRHHVVFPATPSR